MTTRFDTLSLILRILHFVIIFIVYSKFLVKEFLITHSLLLKQKFNNLVFVTLLFERR